MVCCKWGCLRLQLRSLAGAVGRWRRGLRDGSLAPAYDGMSVVVCVDATKVEGLCKLIVAGGGVVIATGAALPVGNMTVRVYTYYTYVCVLVVCC